MRKHIPIEEACVSRDDENPQMCVSNKFVFGVFKQEAEKIIRKKACSIFFNTQACYSSYVNMDVSSRNYM